MRKLGTEKTKLIHILRYQLNSLLWPCPFIHDFVINVGVRILANSIRTSSVRIWGSGHHLLNIFISSVSVINAKYVGTEAL